MSAEEDINGFAWWIGWHPGITIVGVTLFVTAIGFMIADGAGQIGTIAFLGMLVGCTIYFWGTRVINANYDELLNQFVAKTERGAARGIDVAEASTYSLTWGKETSPPFVKPSRIYETTTLVVTGTSVNINQGANYNMAGRNSKGGGTNRELFYDQITAVDSHQDGSYSTLEIRTSGGESIEIGSGATETVDAAMSAVRKRLRDIKAGKDMSMGQQPRDDSDTKEASAAVETETANGSESSSTDSKDITDESETDPKQRCRSCSDRINPEADFCPSCGAESPFEPEGDEQSPESDQFLESDRKQTNTPPAVAEAASTVQRQTKMESSTARKLCRVLADESADETEIQSAINEAVEQLETGVAVSEAVKPVGRRSTIKFYKNIKQNLEQEQGPLPSAVDSVIDRLIQANRKIEEQEETHKAVVAEARMVCEVAARSDAVSFESRETEARLSELAAALENEDVVLTESLVSIESVAETVDRRARPASQLSQQLVNGLRELDDESKLEKIIRESVRMIDEYAETQEMLSEIGDEDVRRRLGSLDRELASRDTPVYSHLADRIRELEALLDDPGSVDDIQLYAIYQEVSYYDRTLLPRLSRSLSGSGSADTEELLSTVRRRIEDVNSEFVSVRPDHNHSIPKHFLSLAEQLVDDAEQELTNRPQRAAGVLLAADAVLDHVQELYERNEYSVMLRRLRG